MKVNQHCHVVLTLTTLLAATSASATPDTVIWSARVANDAGPFNGSVELTLTLFDAAAGGSALHQEHDPSALVVDGELVHELGAAADNPLDDVVLDQASLFLQVTLNGETLSPRLPIRSVPYALRAEQCSTLEGLSADDVATDAELAAALQSLAVPFSALTGIPAGLSDGELTAAPGGGLAVSGNTLAIAAGGVTATMLGSNAVTAGRIAPNAVGQAALQAGAVGASQIADGSITAADIAANAITSSEVTDGSVAAVDLAANAVTSSKIADGTIRDSDVTGVRLYQYSAACSSSGALVLSSTCSSTVCAGGLSTQYYTCSGACAASTQQTCNNTYVGTLVK